ncbi:hypothetical protein J6590_102367 [Homalodisca vitripennis]|nr:hypothetical protein J6590_102367 [Homalodisca vitripennis]
MAGYLQGQDDSAVTHPNTSLARHCLIRLSRAKLRQWLYIYGTLAVVARGDIKTFPAQKAINRAEIKLSTSKIFRTYSQRDQLQRLKHDGFVSTVLKEAVKKVRGILRF